LEFVTSGLAFNGKRILDVGGGIGLLSLYAAEKGARDVVCLEPESDGATSGAWATFETLRHELGANQVKYIASTLQEYNAPPDTFDFILLANSINHIDEWACEHLRDSPEAVERYHDICESLYRLTAPGGTVVITDVSPRNLFRRLPVRNPVAPTIEWHKHQPPEVWRDLLCRQGFRDKSVQWTPFFRLGRLAPRLTGNRFAAYVLQSHFRLVMMK
jgi:SAM-dependent methyltransferase